MAPRQTRATAQVPDSQLQRVKNDLAALAKVDRALADSALAGLALAMAREVDDPHNSATSKSMCGRVLQDALTQLRELTPKKQAKDGLDDLSNRRAKRLAGGATPSA